jgi:hypothetical protein
MTEYEDIDKTGSNTWEGWKKDECRNKLFGAGPKEEQILVDHAEVGIHRNRNRPMAESLNWRRRRR